MEVDIRGAALGFAAALGVLGVLVWVVGVDRVIATFRGLDAAYVALIAGVAVLWLAAWGQSLRTVLGALGVETGPGTAFLLYASAAFANNVTPFGQAGGEPFSALLISRAVGSTYEDGLAAIASVDTINFVPSILLALLGMTYYVAVFAVGGRRIWLVMGAVVAIGIAIPTLGYLAWRNRLAVRERAVRWLGPVLHTVGRVVPGVTPPTRESLRERVDAFFASLERVADDRRRLAVALGFSTLGWLCMMLSLSLSLFALGYPDPQVVAAALIVVPLGSVASITPLPGGLGGVEFAIVALLVPVTGVTAETATAAALVHRGATYWLPTVIGGGATAWLQVGNGSLVRG